MSGISQNGLIHRRPTHILPLDDMIPMLDDQDDVDDFLNGDDDVPILPTWPARQGRVKLYGC